MASANYTAKDITVLEGLDPVRKRPGMYIGGVGSAGLHHLVWETIDNSVDEAMNGFASNIWVTLHADGSSITIEDDGRGIPIDKHPLSKKSALEVIFTVLHAGGKFEHGSYKTAGGLHGVGASVVNALSKELVATVKRDGSQWEMRFKQGKPVSALKKVGPARGTGTAVYFHPDAAIFPKIEFDPAIIKDRLEVASYLHKGLKVGFEDETSKEKVVFEHSEGIVDYLRKIVVQRSARAVHDAPFTLTRDDGLRVDLVLQWTEATDEHLRDARKRAARGNRQGRAQLRRHAQPVAEGRHDHGGRHSRRPHGRPQRVHAGAAVSGADERSSEQPGARVGGGR